MSSRESKEVCVLFVNVSVSSPAELSKISQSCRAISPSVSSASTFVCILRNNPAETSQLLPLTSRRGKFVQDNTLSCSTTQYTHSICTIHTMRIYSSSNLYIGTPDMSTKMPRICLRSFRNNRLHAATFIFC